MDRQPQGFYEQFNSMDSKLLLQRYRTGGLVPEAEAELLSVLESRGYTKEALAQTESRESFPGETAPSVHGVIEHKSNIVSNSHPGLRPFNIALKTLVIPVIGIFVLLAIPIVGNVLVLGGAGLLGCQLGEDRLHPCHLLGFDIGLFVSGYEIDLFLAGGLNPILAFLALESFVRSWIGVVWWASVIAVFFAREVVRKRLAVSVNERGSHN